MKYIDIHTHVNFAVFDEDREEVVRRAQDAGVLMMNVGTQKDTCLKALDIAEKYDNCYACIGLHPVHTSKSFHDEKEIGEGGKEFTSRGEEFDYEYYLELAKHPKVLAIGETGLDYYHKDSEEETLEQRDENAERQKKTFREHIRLAEEVGKPLMIHARPSKGTMDAYDDVIEILKDCNVRANFHFFVGDIATAQKILDLGCTMSFDGPITFARDYDDLIRFLPLESIMVETDAPYAAPIPHRGKRNEPFYVVEIAKAIASIRGEDENIVREKLLENSKKMFGFW
jgi:TatD DNase family protein